MPDVNNLSVSELRDHARYYIGAVRTDAPENLTHNAQMLANLVERLLDEDGLPGEDPSVTAASTLSPAALVDAANEAVALNDDPS